MGSLLLEHVIETETLIHRKLICSWLITLGIIVAVRG
jgi:hypothetical protein